MAALDDTRRRIGAKAAAAALNSAAFKRRYARYGVGVYSDDHEVVARCRRELEKRKHRPNPAARPSADASSAIRALQRSLDQTSEPELRRRLEQAISTARSLYRPPGVTKQPDPPSQPPAIRIIFGTMMAYLVELLTTVDHVDKHGHRIGLDYSTIRERAIAKYPVVPSGRHRGKPTRCNPKELQALAGRLHRAGVVLPFRPRSRSR